MFEFPLEEAVFESQEAFMVGPALLVQPVVVAGATNAEVRLPGGSGQVWYEYESLQKYRGGQTVVVDAPLGKTPVLLRGGSVLPRRDRVRRSSALMHHEPLTLVVVLDAKGAAQGTYYLDDGASYAYEQGVFAHKLVTFANGKLTCTDAAASAATAAGRAAFADANGVGIERIVLVGLPKAPKGAVVRQGAAGADPRAVEATVVPAPATAGVVVHLKRPIANAAADWEVQLAL